MAETKTTAKKRTEATEVWTEEEKAAMQEHAREVKRARGKKADGEADLQAKIAEMPPEDRKLAKRIDALVKATAPELTSRTWYGMPAYYKDGKLICFFQAAAKFKARYATFGFEQNANIDEGSMWATSWAITTDFSDADEAKIADLIKKAVR
jgi:uncharacterized protein YdhG (YjbR/CyaY superfamily)